MIQNRPSFDLNDLRLGEEGRWRRLKPAVSVPS
jgi:hypothetical protein